MEETRRNKPVTHGHAAKSHPLHKLYKVWASMKARCQNPLDAAFHHYGGRGITLCEDWQSYTRFSEWAIANGYAKGQTIERIDNNSGYAPENCCWIPQSKQSRNLRTTNRVIVGGETISVSELAERLGMQRGTLVSRIRRWGSLDKAISTPVRSW